MVVTQLSVLLLGDKFDVWRGQRSASPGQSPVPVYAASTPDEVAALMARVVHLGTRHPSATRVFCARAMPTGCIC